MEEKCIELGCLLWLVDERLRLRSHFRLLQALEASVLIVGAVVLRASGPVSLAICCTGPPSEL